MDESTIMDNSNEDTEVTLKTHQSLPHQCHEHSPVRKIVDTVSETNEITELLPSDTPDEESIVLNISDIEPVVIEPSVDIDTTVIPSEEFEELNISNTQPVALKSPVDKDYIELPTENSEVKGKTNNEPEKEIPRDTKSCTPNDKKEEHAPKRGYFHKIYPISVDLKSNYFPLWTSVKMRKGKSLKFKIENGVDFDSKIMLS